ncbi:cytokine receptor common subunit beta-like isoform X2 [Puntigrus tetrazona]|uniref:cytokine receptor common subunit beta-like isoform X2 n=1 Tax=Puntigrus tetrazona TaxID=1606681 RepID=UPI001C89EAE8|nr:cytokine receptor common subunit beta-like isoform X2 [Puntigrus tetrazona]
MSPNVSLSLALLWTSVVSGCPQLGPFAPGRGCFTVICLCFGIVGCFIRLLFPESSALESLECRNDYRSRISCSWRDHPRLHLSLLHMDPDDQRVSPCVQTPNPSQDPTGKQRAYCQYNTSLFAIGFDDLFFFRTPHSSGLSRAFRLTKPEDADPDWTFYQLDDIPPPSRVTSHPFRRHDRECSSEIDHEIINDKKSGKNRAKPTQKHVEDGENKTEVFTNGPELISQHSLPGPYNFNCVLSDGNNLSCIWDLRTDLAQYISYTLSYRTCSTAQNEWCCVEKVEVTNKGDSLRMIGVFSIFEPGELQVQLTPTPVTKVVRCYEHIQPASPTSLSVELRGEDWILNWTLTKYRTVPLTTELKYWSLLTPEDVKSVFLSDGELVFAISERSLKGSSEYRAQVRCNVSTTRRLGWRYSGYPSDWSDPIYWTTQTEPLAPHLVTFLLYFLIATLASAVSIIAFIILVVIQRRVREWDMSLPSPVHSKVSEVSQHPQMDRFPCCTELKDPDISNAQIVDVRLQLSSFNSKSNISADANNQPRETEGNRVILHVDDPCLVSLCSSENAMERNGPFQPRATNFHDPVLPCSEGYMQNPVATTQNALQKACCLNVEIGDGYMNCPKPDLISPKQRTNPHSIH